MTFLTCPHGTWQNVYSTDMHGADELLDLVDDQDEVLGTIKRSEWTEEKGYIRGIGAFIQNSQGQLWIPTRQLHHKIAPGGLDFSVGEHVMSGESYRAAAVRGFSEELYMNIPSDQLTRLGKLSPANDMPIFCEIFLFHSDTTPGYDEYDYTGYAWLYPQEVAAAIEKGTPAKAALALAITTFLNR